VQHNSNNAITYHIPGSSFSIIISGSVNWKPATTESLWTLLTDRRGFKQYRNKCVSKTQYPPYGGGQISDLGISWWG